MNSLLRKAAVPIYKLSSTQDGPTTTAHAQEIALEVAGKSIRLIDTPGAAWVHAEGLSEEELLALRSRDILARSKGRIDRLKDPEPAGQSSLPINASVQILTDRQSTRLWCARAAKT